MTSEPWDDQDRQDALEALKRVAQLLERHTAPEPWDDQEPATPAAIQAMTDQDRQEARERIAQLLEEEDQAAQERLELEESLEGPLGADSKEPVVAAGALPRISPYHDQFRADHHPGDSVEQFMHRVCSQPFVLPQKKQGNLIHFPCHTCTDNPFEQVAQGWRYRPYLLVLPNPSVEEVAGGLGLCTTDQSHHFLRAELDNQGIPPEDCLVTYACRFALPPGTKAYNAGHKVTCSAYVREDVRQCRPLVVLTFGSDALKALLGQDKALATYQGSVVEFEGVPVVPTSSPKQFLTGYGTIEVFRKEISRAREILEGRYQEQVVDTSGYRVIETVHDMERLVALIDGLSPKHIAFDTEFGSLVKRDEHRMTRSVQISWGAGQAAFIRLRGVSGEHVPGMSPEDYDRIVELTGRLLQDPRWRLDGHLLRTDIDEMYRLGWNCDGKLETGFCTLLVHHLLHGDDDQGLDQLCRKYTPWFGAYWSELEQWLTDNGRANQLQYGYLMVPEEILVPYGLRDADCTWRIAEKLEEELKLQPALWKLYWEVSAPASLAMMDIQRHGIQIDQAKCQELYRIVKPEFDAILQDTRVLLNWPDFNPAKTAQIAAVLYSGTEFKGKKAAPAGAIVMDLKPPFNTDKYPRDWREIEDAQENHLHIASTKSTAIELLIAQDPGNEILRYLKFLSVLGKFLSTYLRPQDLDLETRLARPGKGFAANICDDGRVRGKFHQTSETGRWRSTSPNLQTNPKKQESALLEAFVYRRFGGMSLQEYERRTAAIKSPEDYIPKDQQVHLPSFKEVYVAPPGYGFVEVDFKTAEICVWAYCSGDQALIEMIEQGRDIHCEVATDCFALPVADELKQSLQELRAGDKTRYKKWEAHVKKTYGALRVVAKAVIFGIIYGRGAAALSREINKQGVATDPDQCQETIDGIARRFPGGWKWLKACQEEAINRGYVTNAFGFRRYFSGAQRLSGQVQSAIRRQGPNSAIQGCVAQLANVAAINLYRFRYRTDVGRRLKYRVVLQIHDAFLVEVRLDETSYQATSRVIKLCMSTMNAIPGTDHKVLGVDMNEVPVHSWGDH